MFRTSLFLFLVLFGVAALAADETKPATETKQPPPPPLPEDSSASELPPPEVTIRKREDRIIEEYRVNGQLRYVKVIPNKGLPYYFVDTDGDGVLDQQFNNLDNPPVNQWILMEW
ncbi:DUF2782 domain-containing protein [Kaarinaea lacus]